MSLYRNTVFLVKGLTEFTKGGYEKASKHFTPGALDVDCTGKIAIVTGANSGLGKEVTIELAKRGASVYMLCRNEQRGEEARKEVEETTSNPNVFLRVVDLASLKSIHQFVEKFKTEVTKLDILVNNGGVMVNERKQNDEGVEVNFATNTLGTFYLTNSLVGLLEAGKPSRVITVSSGGMLTQKLHVEDLEFTKMKPFDGTFAYAQNKRQQVVLTELWGEKYHSHCIYFYSCHPGWADTPAVQTSMPEFYDRLHEKFRTTAEGADTIVWLCVANEALTKVRPGDFVQDRQGVSKHLPLAWTHHDKRDEKVLWDKLEEYVAKILTTGTQQAPSPVE